MGFIELSLILTLAAEGQQIDPSILRALCFVESSFRPGAVNWDDGGVGNHSVGLCQVSIETARVLGSLSPREEARCRALRPSQTKRITARDCPLLDPLINAALAAQYLRKQFDRYEGDIAKAVSAYNAGSALKSGNRRYVKKVLKLAGRLSDKKEGGKE